MSDRVSQLAAQILEEGVPRALISQLAAQILADDNPHVRASQLAAQILEEGVSSARASQLAALILYGYSLVRVSQLAAQILVEPQPRARVSQLCAIILVDWPTPPYPEYTMSNAIFPTLPGIKWDIQKTPKWNTTISKHTSGREARVSNYAYPLWSWDMQYEFLREDGGHTELETLAGFFLARSGSFDTFLFADPSESNVIGGISYSLGTGDGLTTGFQLTKTFGGFVEPIGYVDQTTLHVYLNGVLQVSGYSVTLPNMVVFATPPGAGVAVTAAYTWYYRVRFGDDAHDYNNFMHDLWELKKLTLEMVKP
jgi:uncharacterized protein (TIGR02217 family)